jgi:hypothetical protein
MITVTLLRVCGDDVRCLRCGERYRVVLASLAPLAAWRLCPACEAGSNGSTMEAHAVP